MVESGTETIRFKLNKFLCMVDIGTETMEDQLDGDHKTADVYSHMVDSETKTMEDQLYADVCSHMVDSGTKTMGNKHNKLHDMVDSINESMRNKRNKLHSIVDRRTETMEDQLSGDQETADVYSHMVDSETENMEDQLYGDHETQVSEGGEADLHKHLIGCTKNPGHTKFIPVNTFTLNHLPEGHRDKDLYEYINVIAGLTVRVGVKMISPHRPKFWPNTKVLYPFYNMRDKTKWRTGSGMVRGVYKFTDGYSDDGDKHWKNYTTCWCKQCQHSDTASHVWWEFYVNTATHVVFDDIEASHTSLRLFYDREECPVVSVDQVSVNYVNIERDRCVLKCVTCDKNLADKLDMLCRHFDDVWRKVRNKYRESRDVDKLNFIVSHPHGCCKQVSVGHWLDKYKVGGGSSKFTYTTCTCPGSSGALVHCVGYYGGGVRWLYQHVHSGSLNSKLNYSGAGYVPL